MKNIRFPVLGLALTLLVSGCSQGGLSLQEYFSEVQRIQQDTDQATQQAQTATDEKLAAATTDPEGLTVFKSGLEEQLAVLDGAVSEIKALDPPEEAAEAHDRFVEGLEDTIAALQDGIATFGDYTSMQQAAEGLVTPELQAAGSQVDEACMTLVSIANENEIQTTLTCRGQAGEGSPTDAPPVPGPQSSPTN